MRQRPGKLKGLALRALDRAYRSSEGEAAHRAAHARLPLELAEAFERGTLLPASWYPIDWYADLLDAFVAESGGGTALCRRLGRIAARDDMLGLYQKVILKLLSPQLMFSVTQRFFSAFFDTGSVEVLVARRGYASARYSGCIGWEPNMWFEMLGACEAFLEMSGAKHVRGHIAAGGNRGDDFCEIEGRWATSSP